MESQWEATISIDSMFHLEFVCDLKNHIKHGLEELIRKNRLQSVLFLDIQQCRAVKSSGVKTLIM